MKPKPKYPKEVLKVLWDGHRSCGLAAILWQRVKFGFIPQYGKRKRYEILHTCRLLKLRTINTLWLTSDLWKRLPILPDTKWNCSVVASSIIRELLGGGGGIERFRFWTALEWQLCKSDVPLHILLEYCENLKTIIFFTFGKKWQGWLGQRGKWGRGQGAPAIRCSFIIIIIILNSDWN